MENRNESANCTYFAKLNSVREKLALLTEWMEEAADHSKTHHWGEVGDMEQVSKMLDQVLDFVQPE